MSKPVRLSDSSVERLEAMKAEYSEYTLTNQYMVDKALILLERDLAETRKRDQGVSNG